MIYFWFIGRRWIPIYFSSRPTPAYVHRVSRVNQTLHHYEHKGAGCQLKRLYNGVRPQVGRRMGTDLQVNPKSLVSSTFEHSTSDVPDGFTTVKSVKSISQVPAAGQSRFATTGLNVLDLRRDTPAKEVSLHTSWTSRRAKSVETHVVPERLIKCTSVTVLVLGLAAQSSALADS